MKVILIGYMGSGKTSVGKVLAKALNLPFLDLDVEIEKAAAMSIPDLFDKKGEIFFRKIENKILKELLDSSKGFVLATGGGTPCYADSLSAMLQADNATTVYLKAPISILAERLYKEREHRPLLAHITSIEKLTEFVGIHIFERSHFYNQAGMIVKIGSENPEEIAQTIQQNLL